MGETAQKQTDTRVLLALSGGVDSAVAVAMLQKQGYAVTGVVIRFSDAHQEAVERAAVAARELGIPLEVVDCAQAFETKVVQPFCASYLHGETPNPCVLCNPEVKFAVLEETADRLGIANIATGHYARVEKHGKDYRLCAARSLARDQSYMLYRLPQRILSRLLLPLGTIGKEEVRKTAAEQKLSSANAPDSQEICFIPDNDYAGFIMKRGYEIPKGGFVGPEGEDLGPHQGVIHYTVGQRKGLGLSLGRPAYVQSIQDNGDVKLCWKGEGLARKAVLEDVVVSQPGPIAVGDRYQIKIRSVAKPAWCTVSAVENSSVEVTFDQPLFAVAPGQHGVLYTGECVAGGGRIGRRGA